MDAKIREELGDDMQYQLGDIKTTFRVERNEVGRDGAVVRIFAVGYEAQYLSGDIHLSKDFVTYEWIDLKTVKLSDYASPGGWVEQLGDYVKTFRKNT